MLVRRDMHAETESIDNCVCVCVWLCRCHIYIVLECVRCCWCWRGPHLFRFLSSHVKYILQRSETDTPGRGRRLMSLNHRLRTYSGERRRAHRQRDTLQTDTHDATLGPDMDKSQQQVCNELSPPRALCNEPCKVGCKEIVRLIAGKWQSAKDDQTDEDRAPISLIKAPPPPI